MAEQDVVGWRDRRVRPFSLASTGRAGSHGGSGGALARRTPAGASAVRPDAPAPAGRSRPRVRRPAIRSRSRTSQPAISAPRHVPFRAVCLSGPSPPALMLRRRDHRDRPSRRGAGRRRAGPQGTRLEPVRHIPVTGGRCRRFLPVATFAVWAGLLAEWTELGPDFPPALVRWEGRKRARSTSPFTAARFRHGSGGPITRADRTEPGGVTSICSTCQVQSHPGAEWKRDHGHDLDADADLNTTSAILTGHDPGRAVASARAPPLHAGVVVIGRRAVPLCQSVCGRQIDARRDVGCAEAARSLRTTSA